MSQQCIDLIPYGEYRFVMGRTTHVQLTSFSIRLPALEVADALQPIHPETFDAHTARSCL